MGAHPSPYAEIVLDLVADIPPGRVSTYGVLAELAAERTSSGGPRQVAAVLRHYGGGVPWWRVCAAGGRLADAVAARQRPLLEAEGVPFTRAGRVDVRAVGWPD